MADSFVLELCKALGNKLLEEGSLLLGVPEEAQNLQQKLWSIQAVLADAERQEVMKDSVKSWITELKDEAYDVEDVLDDWTIAEMLKQDEPGTSKRGNKAKGKVCLSCLPTPCLCFKQAERLHRIAYAIIEINGRLDGIAKRKHDFSLEIIHTDRNEKLGRPVTTQFRDAHFVPSQEKARIELIQKLVHDEFLNNNLRNYVPIISLVGMGGIGKTTLARLVYNDSIVEGHFPNTIWVCVSDIFDKMKVAKAIAEALQLNVGYLTALQNVLQAIADSITGKKFFLVLDDVWTEREEDWSDILSCLGKGDPRGSRILLTTRKEIVAEKMRSCFTFPVGYLSEEESWSLFSYFAFSEKTEEDRERVKDIARELVGKCKGLPLAVEVLGRFMYTKRCTVSEWDNVLRSRVWETQFGENIFPSLVLSYLELPSAAKRCFVFCSVFPKDTIILKNDLIRLWMAQGYLGGTNQMEAIGEDCFNTLVMRSFFQLKEKNYSTDIAVTMHDIVHDLAQYISNGEVDILDPTIEKCKDRARHLSFSGILSESKCSSSGFVIKKPLRSLFASIDSELVLKEICSNTSYLRVLDLRLISSDSETVVDDYGLKNIAKLAHLRYLRLDFSTRIVLPEEICDLHFLQTLDLRLCTGIKKLPKGIERLTSLRHLVIDERAVELDDIPKGLGRLSSLRTLGPLCPISSKLDSGKFSLEDLGALKNLRGSLILKKLNQAADVTEAIKAELHMKKHIYRLTLRFGDGDASIQLKVVEALRAAKENLESLTISDYRGRRCPQWIAQLSLVKEIQLFHVSIESLPGLGNLRFLERLTVEHAEEVKCVGAEFLGKQEEENVFFPKLSYLSFRNMPQWKLWEYHSETMRNRVNVMPSLHRLGLIDCPELRGLPHFLEFLPLETLLVMSCGLPPVKLVKDDHSKRFCIGDITLPHSLRKIVIRGPNGSSVELENKETAVPKESELGQQQHLVNSNYLSIDIGKDYMMPTTPGWIIDLTNLKEITFSTVLDECFPPFGLLPSLEELTIRAREVEKVGDEFLGTLSNDNQKNGDHKAGGGERSKALVAFPKLKKLSFSWMHKWKEWEGPQVQKSTYDVVIMPSLSLLEFEGPSNLKDLPNFLRNVPLEKLKVNAIMNGMLGNLGMPRILRGHTMDQDEPPYKTILAHNLQEIDLVYIKNSWIFDWGMYCVRLKKLDLWLCHTPSLTGLGVLPSLETLQVGCCYEIKRLGKEFAFLTSEDLENMEQHHQLEDIRGGDTTWRQIRPSSSYNIIFNTTVSFPSLKELYFEVMPRWKEWDDPHRLEESIEWTRDSTRHGGDNNSSATTNVMPNLQILSLKRCSDLKALPNFIRYVALEQLTIEGCDALNTWWEYDAGEDWLNWKSQIAQVDIIEEIKTSLLHCTLNSAAKRPTTTFSDDLPSPAAATIFAGRHSPLYVL